VKVLFAVKLKCIIRRFSATTATNSVPEVG